MQDLWFGYVGVLDTEPYRTSCCNNEESPTLVLLFGEIAINYFHP